MVQAYHIQEADKNGAKGIDRMRYHQLLNLEDFAQCTYLQTLVEFVPPEQKFNTPDRHPDGTLTEDSKQRIARYTESIQKRKRQKDENFLYTRRYQSALINITRGSDSPYLLYYHWSREQNKEALDALRYHYENGDITQYDMLFFLSQAYAPYEPLAAKKMLLDSLSDYPPSLYTSKNPPDDKKEYVPKKDDGNRLHYPAMRYLVQLYYSEQNYAMSYLFSRLLHLNKDRSSRIAMIREQLAPQVNTDKLDDIADTLHDALLNGEFTPHLIPKGLSHG